MILAIFPRIGAHASGADRSLSAGARRSCRRPHKRIVDGHGALLTQLKQVCSFDCFVARQLELLAKRSRAAGRPCQAVQITPRGREPRVQLVEQAEIAQLVAAVEHLSSRSRGHCFCRASRAADRADRPARAPGPRSRRRPQLGWRDGSSLNRCFRRPVPGQTAVQGVALAGRLAFQAGRAKAGRAGGVRQRCPADPSRAASRTRRGPISDKSALSSSTCRSCPNQPALRLRNGEIEAPLRRRRRRAARPPPRPTPAAARGASRVRANAGAGS